MLWFAQASVPVSLAVFLGKIWGLFELSRGLGFRVRP